MRHVSVRARVLPHYLRPKFGEAFASYLNRLAHNLNAPLITTLRATGLIDEEYEKQIGPGYGVMLPEERLRNFAHVTRLSVASVEAMLLSHYDGRVADLAGLEPTDATSFRKVSLREWAYFSGSHLCPKCVEEDNGAWQLAWKLPWSFACVKHSVLLIDTCPSCQRRTGLSRQDGASRPRFVSHVPLLGGCMNAQPAGLASAGRSSQPCGQPLALIPTESLEHGSALLATQQTLDEALERESIVAGGVETPSLTYFTELRSLSALLLYTAKVEDLGNLSPLVKEAFAEVETQRDALIEERYQLGNQRNGPHTRVFSSSPQSAAVMAAILPTAVDILSAPSTEYLAKRIGWLVERGIERKHNKVRQLADYLSFSPRLRDVFERRLESRKPFVRKLERNHATSSQVSSYSFTLDHVPQLFWQETYRQSFAKFLPGIGEDYARRVCSMALVRLSGNYTWLEAAEALGLPPKPACGMANKVVSILGKEETAGMFTERLHGFASELSNNKDRIDYEYRRRAFAGLTEIEWEAWCLLCQRANTSPGLPRGRQGYAAVWVWCHLTGGDYRLAPGLQETNVQNRREVYRRFLKKEQPRLEKELVAFVKDILCLVAV